MCVRDLLRDKSQFGHSTILINKRIRTFMTIQNNDAPGLLKLTQLRLSISNTICAITTHFLHIL